MMLIYSISPSSVSNVRRSSAVYYFLWLTICQTSLGDLVINFSNRGDEVLQEIIAANKTTNSVTLEYVKFDGTVVTQVVDSANNLTIIRILQLGEEELGQLGTYQAICFVIESPPDEFIPPDAMSKLRQKNPGSIRSPEEDRGRDNQTFDSILSVEQSQWISPLIPSICDEAHHSTFVRSRDVQFWAAKKGVDASRTVQLSKPVPSQISNRPLVCDDFGSSQPCLCRLQIVIPWFPCALKYCKVRDSATGRKQRYRCGIRTCKRIRSFSFLVENARQCLLDGWRHIGLEIVFGWSLFANYLREWSPMLNFQGFNGQMMCEMTSLEFVI